jgi:uncharacterized membrane protein
MALGWGGDKRRRGRCDPGIWSSVVVGRHRSAVVVFVWAMGDLVAVQVPFGPSRLTPFFDARVRNSCVRK